MEILKLSTSTYCWSTVVEWMYLVTFHHCHLEGTLTQHHCLVPVHLVRFPTVTCSLNMFPVLMWPQVSGGMSSTAPPAAWLDWMICSSRMGLDSFHFLYVGAESVECARTWSRARSSDSLAWRTWSHYCCETFYKWEGSCVTGSQSVCVGRFVNL